MAKKRSSSRKARRDPTPIASRRLSGRYTLPEPTPVSLPRRPPFHYPATDARIYHPDQLAKTSYRTITGTPARVVAPPPRKRLLERSKPIPGHSRSVIQLFQSVPASLLFSEPKKALHCIRRSVRRQVLAARGRLGANRYRKPSNPVRC